MPVTTIQSKGRKPATRRRVVTKDVPTVEPPFANEPLPERTAWVLRSHADKFDGPEYFYDGEVQVRNGVVSIPVRRVDWAKRLLFSGYTFADPRDESEFNAAIEA